MSFTSGIYFVFLIAVFFAYWLTPARRRVALLLACNCAFYAYAGWRPLLLLAAVCAVDFTTARLMAVDAEQRVEGLHRPVMNGRSVILHAVRKLADAADEISARHHLTPADIDLVVPHQANANLLRQVRKRLGMDERRVVTNLAHYGNTSGASAFIALDRARRERHLPPGARTLVLAFGAGFTWGATLLTGGEEQGRSRI